MNRRSSNALPLADREPDRRRFNASREAQFKLRNTLPIGAGWHRLKIEHVATDEVLEVRLDFGLGFVGHHAVRVRAGGNGATLFVRLFKDLRGVRLLRNVNHSADEFMPEIEFDRLPGKMVWARRFAEQLQLWRRTFARKRATQNRHDAPRRLWKWSGLQAFAETLPADGESSYAQWRRLRPSIAQDSNISSLDRWLVVVDMRASSAQQFLGPLVEASVRAGIRAIVVTEPNGNVTPSELDAVRNAGALVVSEKALFAAGDVMDGSADWLLMVRPDVELDAEAGLAFATAAESPGSAVIYSDNDHRSDDGARFGPDLRTSFSVERLRSEDWLGGAVAFRAASLRQSTSWQRASLPTMYELACEMAETLDPRQFIHIPDVLYSRLRRSITTQGTSAARPAPGGPAALTTVIIPTRNRADLLERCVDSIINRTAAPFEIVIHDNGSDDPRSCALLKRLGCRDGIRVLRDDQPFNFSRINNDAAEIARGELLVFLNNDTEVLSDDWIAKLAQVALDPSVGCVGPLLLQPNGRIQHAGLVTGPGGIAVHVHSGLRVSDADVVAPIVRRDVSAVTGACLAIEKSKFRAAGGFDAAGLPVAFNDVDLCLRLERRGLRNVFLPEVLLLHVGSATRANDDFTRGSDRFRAEFKLMRERWGERLDSDPFFPQHMRLTNDGPQLCL